MSQIEIKFENGSGLLISSAELPDAIWVRVRQLALDAYPDAEFGPQGIRLPWANLLALLRELSPQQRLLGFKLTATGEAKDYIKKFQDEFRAARAVRPDDAFLPIATEEIDIRLRSAGFTKRSLKPHQVRDVRRMLSLAHGANFSVPGAGKTTVTFAVHLLNHALTPYLLVIAPKNAFSAWDEVVIESIGEEAPEWAREPFYRFTGDEQAFRSAIRMGRHRFITNYERVMRAGPLLEELLIENSVHLVLDESHRIKGGQEVLRGQALLRLSPFATRRDILSGTPAPHSVWDLGPQIDFLWPASGLDKKILESPTPSEALKGLYVRTTKKDLDLPPREQEFIHVPMSDPQLALYGLLRSEFLRQYGGRGLGGGFDVFRARNNAMRLLQVATNPILAARGLAEFLPEENRASELVRSVIRSGNSPKIIQACEMTRKLVASGQKVVIWTIFVETIGRIRDELIDLSPIELHGAIPAGDPEDPRTREFALHRFHSDKNCQVAIANPAACGEGISLHKICHHAIYLDRSYNAGHYLQSIDRIHRLGLDPGTTTYIHILQSVAPSGLGSIDHSVSRRLATKIRGMQQILDDQDLHEIALEEEEAEVPVDSSITLEDIQDLIEQLSAPSIPDGDDAA